MVRPKKPTKAELLAVEQAELRERIRATLDGWYPGKWAELVNYGPACNCGLRMRKGPCHVHTGTGTAMGEDGAGGDTAQPPTH